jgi:hypothetical protein
VKPAKRIHSIVPKGIEETGQGSRSRFRCIKGIAEQSRYSDFLLHHVLTKRFRLPSRRKACTPRTGAGYLYSSVDSFTLPSAATRETTPICSSEYILIPNRFYCNKTGFSGRLRDRYIILELCRIHTSCRAFRGHNTVYSAQQGTTILCPPNSPWEASEPDVLTHHHAYFTIRLFFTPTTP